MKECSLHDFMKEMKPWLDKSYIHIAFVDNKGHFTLHFLDGTKNVYHIDDCNREQIAQVLEQLKDRGIKAELPEEWNLK